MFALNGQQSLLHLVVLVKLARYKIHDAANIFPLMSDEELDRLVADIKLNGLHEPVVLLDGVVLDGRNRLRACEQLGIRPTIKELRDCEDPLGFVRSANLHRRHLTKGQRIICAACATTLIRGTNQHRVRKVDGSREPSITIDQACHDFSVSSASIKRARQIVARGASEVIDAVKQGHIPVSLAARFVGKVEDKKEQCRITRLGVDEIRKVVMQPRRKLKLSQHVEKLVSVIAKIREKWPPEHLNKLTEELATLSKEIRKGVQCPRLSKE